METSRMSEFDGELRDLGPVPETLLSELDRKLAEAPQLWLAEDGAKPNRFGVFEGSTLHIVFQYPVDLRFHQLSSYSDLWETWSGVVEPIIAHATQGYGYREGRTARILLARLLAGKAIRRHIDGSPSAEVPHKIHVPLSTNPGVIFKIGEGSYHLERGRAYEVNNRRHHEVMNESNQDRVHLIFDYWDGV